MTNKNSDEVPNMRQRTVLQHLSLADWRMVNRLPVSASEVTLSRLLHHGWIESRGEKQRAAVRLTPAGLTAMRSPIMKAIQAGQGKVKNWKWTQDPVSLSLSL